MAARKPQVQASAAQGMEDIFIPRPGNEKNTPGKVVSVNGKTWILPWGETSTVPSYVADEIRRAWAAEEEYYRRAEEMQKQAQQ